MSELLRGERTALTGWEKALRVLAWVIAAVSVGAGGVYVWSGVVDNGDFPYAVNSVAKDFLLTGLCVLLARDVRRNAAATLPMIVAVHLVMPAILVLTELRHRSAYEHTMTIEFIAPSAGELRWGWFSLDLVVVVLFLWFSFMATRSRYGLQYLWPGGYRALISLAEVLVLEPGSEMKPAEIGHRADRYLASFRAPEKLKVWASFQLLAYWPVISFHPPFHVMSPESRKRWVQRRFLDQTRDWLVPRFVRDLRRAIIRTAQQFSFMGYYGDEKAAAEVGYIPFSKLEKSPRLIATRVERSRPGVHCLTPGEISGTILREDFVIVGSGAAGAMLAHELAKHGRNVLILERGSHVDPASFTENEADQLARLYRDGALTLSKDYRFQVAQGMCVGGSTVVNNAVCFRLPDPVRDRWNAEFAAGLDARRLTRAFDYVERFLDVATLGPPARRNPGAEHMVELLKAMPPHRRPFTLEPVACNIRDCLGCGYCNIGCSYGKKLSALDHTLPKAQKLPGRVRVLPDCQVSKIVKRDGRACDVKARLADGRRLTIVGNSAVILSAGALASSVILQRSGFGERKAGKRLAFNMASPVTLQFALPKDRKLHSERGAQISHYFAPANQKRDGVVLETWFNPVVTQSLFMPGWFEQHRTNMRDYANMTCLGVVVGTESNASVKPGLTRGGVNLSYDPTDDDFVKIKQSVQLACEIGLRLDAKRVMPSTFHYNAITRLADLPSLESAIGDGSELLLNSAHPQGGNPISADPKRGVVGTDFQVYGAPGLYVCDASVFPSSITVNPQLTVMALAVYAADEIVHRR